MQLQRENLFFLRIKKEFMDRIESGQKTVEYRSVLPSYRKLEDPCVKFLILHYQTTRRLIVQIKSVAKIPCPERLKNSPINFTPEVYEIQLGKSKLLSE